MNKTGFSKRLIRLMSERKVTVRQAADSAQVATSTVQNWRSGHTPSNFAAVKRLAAYLNVSFSFLLTGEEDQHNSKNRLSMTECFNLGESIFDGYARVTIQELIPNKSMKR